MFTTTFLHLTLIVKCYCFNVKLNVKSSYFITFNVNYQQYKFKK